MVYDNMDFFKSRNFILSSIVLAICLMATGTFAVYKQREFVEASRLLDHTHKIIYETQDLSSQILSLIALQRGYLLTRDESFNRQYIEKQSEISSQLNILIESQSDNPIYSNKLLEFQTHYLSLVEMLDSRISDPNANIADTKEIEKVKDQIRTVRNSFLDDKYAVLDSKIKRIGTIQERLILGLLVGIFLTGLILTSLNYYLFRLRKQNRIIGRDLFNSEERLQYAMLASGEGVYDINVKEGTIYCSRYFIEMLGYNPDIFIPTMDMLVEMIHPEDKERVTSYLDQYINDQLSEYSLEFRMQHSSGRYVWISSRAIAIRGDDGRALRLIGTHRDITNHKLVEENLEKEAIQAERDSAAKSDFLAHMSHEIRTPLTTISGISEILKKKEKDFDDRQKELINTLNTSAKALRGLINDILDFSKIEKGEVELENEHFLLGNLVSEIISIMAVPANEKGLNFKVLYDDIKYYEYFGDESRIKQILINLIGNAIKFTDVGNITVMATVEKRKDIEFLSFAVHDTGIGIENDMLDYVFLEFKQEDSSISRKYGGTGLGLPISKKLATLMGGDLHVESKKGLGSTFTLYLPIENRGLKLIDNDDLQLKDKITDKLTSVIQDQQCALIVEDYEGNIVILSYLMEEIGLKFDIARSGVQALDLWKSKHYDLVLMDVQMPEMDGLSATTEIRRLEDENKFERTPIIGMTAHALIQDKNKCIDSGMTDYVSKPINNDVLKEKILKYITPYREQTSEPIKQNTKELKKTGTV